MSYEAFDKLLENHVLPDRMLNYITNTYIPTIQEIEEADRFLESHNDDQTYFGNYNNLIFLQKKMTKKFRKARKEEEKAATVAADVNEMIKTVEFPDSGKRIIFN